MLQELNIETTESVKNTEISKCEDVKKETKERKERKGKPGRKNKKKGQNPISLPPAPPAEIKTKYNHVLQELKYRDKFNKSIDALCEYLEDNLSDEHDENDDDEDDDEDHYRPLTVSTGLNFVSPSGIRFTILRIEQIGCECHRHYTATIRLCKENNSKNKKLNLFSDCEVSVTEGNNLRKAVLNVFQLAKRAKVCSECNHTLGLEGKTLFNGICKKCLVSSLIDPTYTPNQCCICYNETHEKRMFKMSCIHKVCLDCAPNIDKCPLCRQTI